MYNKSMGKKRSKKNKHYPERLYFNDAGWAFYRLQRDGRDIKIPLETMDFGKALERWAIVHADYEKKYGFSREKIEYKVDGLNAVSFQKMIERYMDEISPTKGENTYRNELRMADEILKYFDGSPIFKIEEFTDDTSFIKLCDLINSDFPHVRTKTKMNTIQWLNYWIKLPSFYKLVAANKNVNITREIQKFAEDVGKITKTENNKLSYGQHNMVKELNRFVLEQLYPGCAPQYKKSQHYAHEITRYDVNQWYKGLHEKPFEATRRWRFLHHVYEVAQEDGWKYVKENPVVLMKTTKKYNTKVKAPLYLTHEILFNYIYENAEPNLQKAIMFAFFLAQHENEVKRIMWNRKEKGNINETYRYIDRKSSCVVIERQKTINDNNGPYIIDYSENLVFCKFINDIFQGRNNLSPYVITYPTSEGPKPYSSFKKMWQKALKKVENTLRRELNDPEYRIPPYKFKEMRHLANTLMKDNNISKDKRMAVTCQSSPDANDFYTHRSPKDSRDALKALASFGPKKYLEIEKNEYDQKI